MRPTKIIFALFILGNLWVCLRSAEFYGGVIRGTDGQMYYAFVRSLVLDGDLDFANEFVTLPPHPEQIYEHERTLTGKLANKYPIGTAITIAPWFIAAHLVTLILNLLGLTNLPTDGYSFFYDRFTGIGLCVYGLIGAWATWTFLDQSRERLLPLLITLGAWFGTTAFYYVSIFPLMSHSPALCVVSLALLLAKRIEEDEPRSSENLLLPLAFFSTLALLIRPPCAPLLLYPAWVVIRRLTNYSVKQWSVALSVSLLMVFFQLAAWKTIFGSWIVYSYGKEPFFFLSPEWSNVLFSSTRGLFFWTPVTLLAFTGLLVGVEQLMFRFFLLSFILTLYISAAWHSWWFGHGFGARQFTEFFPVFSAGLLFLFEGRCAPPGRSARATQWRIVWLIAGALCLAWTSNLLVLYCYARLPFQGAVELNALTPFWM